MNLLPLYCLSSAENYFDSLTEKEKNTILVARNRDIFLPCMSASAFVLGIALPSDPLKAYFLWKVARFEGCVSHAVDRIHELAGIS